MSKDKHAGTFEFANLAVVTFFIIGVFQYFFEKSSDYFSDQTMSFLVNIFFLHGLHGLFQYWMIYKNPDYKRAVEITTGLKNIVPKMVLVTLTVATIILIAKTKSTSFAILQIIFLGWAMLHTLGQTYGIYCAKMIDSAGATKTNKIRADFKLLKIFVYFSVIAQILSRLLSEYLPQYSFSQTWIWLFVAVKIILLLSVLAWLIVNKRLNQDSAWILSRFGFSAATLFFPYAYLALVAIHGAEYFDIAYKAEKRAKNKSKNTIATAVLVSVFFMLVIEGVFSSFTPDIFSDGAERIIASVALAITLVHYLFDTFAYKMRDPEARAILVQIIK